MLALRLLTFFKGKCVGVDDFGNRYYQERFFFGAPKGVRPRRWVCYRGFQEASKVPPLWHGWLHYTTDRVPQIGDRLPEAWEKPHLPNLTGTQWAYVPTGHPLKSSKRPSKAYQPWVPE